ncbi:cation diffusion facilitator family transporter [Aquisediminimonas sediminicola]|uniref:cation diffusion facilitator family transporter n=1 Tax=Alteraquisediminimonas sediminicola TaxID=2676787 RepID=UPI001C8D9ED0|nr:cation diffusion facilitator family transporter [Aquisediminimonas sediminicola]
MSNNHAHFAERERLTTLAASASIAMAILLAILKSWAAWQTGSVAMLGSLADSTLDILASGVTLYAVRLSAAPADLKHGFGHGKAEALAALFQAGIVTASAFAIGVRAIMNFSSAAQPTHPELGIGVSVIALAGTIMLVLYQRYIVKRTGSIAIQADHIHYSSDILLNASVIIALVLDSWLGLRGADPIFGVGIAFWLIWHARDVAGHAIGQLMDQEWPLEKRERFVAIASTHPELKGIHDMRTRTSGSRDFVQFHVWVNPNLTVYQAHRVMDEIEAALMAEFPGTEVLIHPDPEGHTDQEMGYVPSLDIEHRA